MFANLARDWTLSGTYEYQPGALLNWGRIFFNGNLADIAKKNPEIALLPDGTFDTTKTWFNTDAGFVKATADQPAGFQKRVFPFRVDGVRGYDLSMVNMSVARTFRFGGSRSFQFRVDTENLFNRQHYGSGPGSEARRPLGRVRTVRLTFVMRIYHFNDDSLLARNASRGEAPCLAPLARKACDQIGRLAEITFRVWLLISSSVQSSSRPAGSRRGRRSPTASPATIRHAIVCVARSARRTWPWCFAMFGGRRRHEPVVPASGRHRAKVGHRPAFPQLL